MVEYASITAALAILASSLGGVVGRVTQLPANDVRAATLVVAAARAQQVPGAQARSAYAKAPYRRPALRYLYTVGWIGAASDRARCQAALLLGPDPREAATAALRQAPALLARIRAAGLTVAQAATAIARGSKDGCG